jgi:hypothetical protein
MADSQKAPAQTQESRFLARAAMPVPRRRVSGKQPSAGETPSKGICRADVTTAMRRFLDVDGKKHRECLSEDDLGSSSPQMPDHGIDACASAGVALSDPDRMSGKPSVRADEESTVMALVEDSRNSRASLREDKADPSNTQIAVHAFDASISTELIPPDSSLWQAFKSQACTEFLGLRGKLKQGGNTC